jgi:hypothetical protein
MPGSSPANLDPASSVRSSLTMLGLDFDADSQLKAIRALLQHNKNAKAGLAKHISENPNALGRSESLMHDSLFQDAAQSMAAVGMLAPFLKTVFTQYFRSIGDTWAASNLPPAEHERWRSAHAIEWDCNNVLAKGRSRIDLVQGILQLADAISLRPYLPSKIEETLTALFAYRDKMFHHGFEWPLDQRIAFQNQMNEQKWPASWFTHETFECEPWIFTMTDEFIDHCLKTADEVLTAFAKFVCDEKASS